MSWRLFWEQVKITFEPQHSTWFYRKRHTLLAAQWAGEPAPISFLGAPRANNMWPDMTSHRRINDATIYFFLQKNIFILALKRGSGYHTLYNENQTCSWFENIWSKLGCIHTCRLKVTQLQHERPKALFVKCKKQIETNLFS